MKIYKVETYLPEEALDAIRTALYELGYGKVGNYDCCLSWWKINSSWRAKEGARPYLGKLMKLNLPQNTNLNLGARKKICKKLSMPLNQTTLTKQFA